MITSGHAYHAISWQTLHPDEENNFKTTVAIQSGVLNAISKEYVFSNGYKISELDWEIQPMYFLGFSFNMQFFKKFFLNAGTWRGLNQDIGYMQDYDYDNTGKLTNYSKHDCVLQKSVNYDLNMGYNYKIFKDFSIAGLLGFNYKNFKMSAKNGYYQYPPGSVKKLFFGTGVSNEQTFNIPYLGVGSTGLLYDLIIVQLFAMYSKLVYVDEIDYHYRRQIDIYTSMKYGQYIAGIFSLGWKISKNTSIVVMLNYTKFIMQKGDSHYIDLSSGERSPKAQNTGNISYSSYVFILSLEQSLRW